MIAFQGTKQPITVHCLDNLASKPEKNRYYLIMLTADFIMMLSVMCAPGIWLATRQSA
uniref:Uncharacterized protein n=1 Tax=Anguilla anguilla TaxID=7936 RepID=A0A0E9XIK8_ANGAN